MKTLKLSRGGRELMVLRRISKDAKASYRQLGKEAGVSCVAVHVYMSDFFSKGLVARSGGSNRTMRYSLTVSGSRYLADLEIAYARDVEEVRKT